MATAFLKKKFLFISWESLSGDLAWNLKKEGHEVKCYIRSQSDMDVYQGFLERVNDWKRWVKWADVIIFDDVYFGRQADRLRKVGKFVIGGSRYTDALETDREFGQEELLKKGINILPQWNFKNYEKAIKFIKKHPARYVFKPSENGGYGTDTSLMFLGQDESGNDLLDLLEQNKDVWTKKAPVFQLQKYISGVEIAVGAFFNGQDFIYPINVNFEHKRLFPGDLGPFTGEMGTLMYWDKPTNPIFSATLEKMKPALIEAGYHGYIDLNCIVTGKGIYPLEFTARFGYPTIPIQLEGITMPTGEWLYQLAKGQQFELKTKKGFQIGVRIMVPTYFCDERDKATINTYRDLPILFKKPDYEGVHIEDVKLVDETWRVAGSSGCLLVVTGSGTTVDEARKKVYRRLENISIQNMFYRVDIGNRWFHDSDKLQTWGYL